MGLGTMGFLKKRVGLVVFALIFLLPFIASPLWAATDVSGDITSDTVWDLAGSPYHVTGYTTVKSGVTLTIQAGVRVELDEDVTLRVEGTLQVDGNSSNPVVFTWSTPGERWGGIYFYGDGSSSSYIHGAVIEGARGYSYDGAVYISQSSPEISNNLIRFCKNYGVYVSSGSPSIHNNIVTDCEVGIYYYGGGGTVQYNTLVSNKTGFRAFSSATPTVSYNIISYNSTGIYGGSSVIFSHNCVSMNAEDYDSTTASNTDVQEDPQFLGIHNWDYHTAYGSPASSLGAYANGGNPPTYPVTFNTTSYTTNGDLIQNEEWSGVITLNGSVTVPAGTVLRIDPGTTVNMCSDCVLKADGGRLEVMGTTSSPVHFQRSISTQAWSGLYFYYSPTTSLLEGAVIEGARGYSYDGAVYITHSSPEISNNLIRSCENDGIYVSSGSPWIHNNIVTGCEYGIYCYGGTPVVENNTVVNCSEMGIRVSSYSTPDIINNIIAYCHQGFYGHALSVWDYNDFWNNDIDSNVDLEGTTNFSVDPQFVNMSALTFEGFYLQDSSGCIDAGDPSPQYYDVNYPPSKGNIRNDVGFTGGPRTLCPLSALAVDLRADRTSGGAPLTVNFLAAGCCPQCSILTYKWDFENDGTVDATTTVPYITHTYSTYGTHVAKVTVENAQHDTASDTLTIIVQMDNPPTVSIVYPTNGATVSGTVTVTANATDDIGISRVEFYVDGVLVSTDTTSPYQFTWDTTAYSNGNHTITVIAYDTSSQTAQDSVSVTVSNGGGDNPPTVSIVYPTNGATVSGTVTVTANATDDIGISRVEFYVDGVLVSTDTTSPYQFTWDTTAYSNGNHTITVIAYDTSSQTAYANVSVTVGNGGGGVSVSFSANQTYFTGSNDYTSSHLDLQVTVSGISGQTGDVYFYLTQPAYPSGTNTYYFIYSPSGGGNPIHFNKGLFIPAASPVPYLSSVTFDGSLPLAGDGTWHLYGPYSDEILNDGWVPPGSHPIANNQLLPDGDYIFTIEYHVNGQVYSDHITVTLDRY